MPRRSYLGLAVGLLILELSVSAQRRPGVQGGGPYPQQAPTPGPPGFAPFPMMMGPQTPELARKMAAIGALREIQNLRMTEKDITIALPFLKELREGEKGLEAQAGEA